MGRRSRRAGECDPPWTRLGRLSSGGRSGSTGIDQASMPPITLWRFQEPVLLEILGGPLAADAVVALKHERRVAIAEE